jgi:hypothetical protein
LQVLEVLQGARRASAPKERCTGVQHRVGAVVRSITVQEATHVKWIEDYTTFSSGYVSAEQFLSVYARLLPAYFLVEDVEVLMMRGFSCVPAVAGC